MKKLFLFLLFLILIPTIILCGKKKEITITLISNEGKKVLISKKAAKLSQTIQNIIGDCPGISVDIPFRTNDIIAAKDILQTASSYKKNKTELNKTLKRIVDQKKHAMIVGSLVMINPAQTPYFYKYFLQMLGSSGIDNKSKLSQEYKILKKKPFSNTFSHVMAEIDPNLITKNIHKIIETPPSKLNKYRMENTFNQYNLMETFLKLIDFLETPDFLCETIAEFLVKKSDIRSLKYFIKAHELSFNYDLIKYFKRLFIKEIVDSDAKTVGSYIKNYSLEVKNNYINLRNKKLYSLAGIDNLAGKNICVLSLAKNTIFDEKFDVDADYKPLGESFPNLVTLDLSNNRLEILTRNILGNLNNLKTLIIHNNNIVEIKYDAFKYLHNLTKLDLSHNKIEDTEAFHCLTNLTHLNLRNNQIDLIQSKVCKKLTKLEKLDLSRNDIMTVSNLKKFVNLKTLKICYSNIVKKEDNFEQKIIDFITKTCLLKKLYINYTSQKLQSLCNQRGIKLEEI